MGGGCAVRQCVQGLLSVYIHVCMPWSYVCVAVKIVHTSSLNHGTVRTAEQWMRERMGVRLLTADEQMNVRAIGHRCTALIIARTKSPAKLFRLCYNRWAPVPRGIEPITTSINGPCMILEAAPCPAPTQSIRSCISPTPEDFMKAVHTAPRSLARLSRCRAPAPWEDFRTIWPSIVGSR
jgi:hypothetical protein